MLVYTFFVLAVLGICATQNVSYETLNMCSTECEGNIERCSAMKNKPILPANMLLNQLEEALEERQSDRRQSHRELPEGIRQDRRKTDRRAQKQRKH